MIKMGEKKPSRNMAPAQKRPAKPGKKKPVPMPKPKPRKPGLLKPVPMPKPGRAMGKPMPKPAKVGQVKKAMPRGK